MYALVLIQYGIKSLDKTFIYEIPHNLKVSIGNKVMVCFNNRNIYGIVLDIKDSNETEYIPSFILDVINPKIKLNTELIELGKYIKKETFSSLIKVYQTMFPSSLKVKEIKNNYENYNEYLILNKSKEEIENYIIKNKRATARNTLLKDILEKGKVNKKDYINVYKKLIELDLIKIEKERIYRINKDILEKENYTLTNEQEKVIKDIKLNETNTYLLFGVTGSGKTIVYIDLIKKILKLNKTAIMLVPEISLTTQMVNRFYKSFGKDVAILHSGLSDGEKYDEYSKINNKEIKVVVGTRSAIFAPLENLGVIIIDEEHSTTYKQENNPRYNAIDVAKWRAKYNNCPLI